MSTALTPIPDWPEMAPLFAELDRTADPMLREQLIVAYLPFAQALARRYRGRGPLDEELEQVASIGLVLSVDRFDPDHGAAFPSFAAVTILGEVRRHFRDRTWAVRPPRRLQERGRELTRLVARLEQQLGREPRIDEIAAESGIAAAEVVAALQAASAYRSASLDAPLGGEEGFSLSAIVSDEREGDDAFDLVVDLESLRRHLLELPPRERRLLGLRYFSGWTQDRIAADLGISQMHVSRLLTKTLDALREELVAASSDAA